MMINSSLPCPNQTCTRTVSEIGFALICAVTVTGNSQDTTNVLEWFHDMFSLPSDMTVSNKHIMFINASNTTYTSTLQAPLQLSHAGVYTCRVRGNERSERHINITVHGTQWL